VLEHGGATQAHQAALLEVLGGAGARCEHASDGSVIAAFARALL
jgi:hypothetical protein